MASKRKLKNAMWKARRTDKDTRIPGYITRKDKETGETKYVRIICYHRDKELVSNADGTMVIKCNMCGRVKAYKKGDAYRMKPMYEDDPDYKGQIVIKPKKYELDDSLPKPEFKLPVHNWKEELKYFKPKRKHNKEKYGKKHKS